MPVLNPPSSILNPPVAPRISALDWVKGALVIFMVIYHAINYSVFRPMAFQYLSFLPPSFILIAGFLVGQVYASKYNLGEWKPYLRLAIRGLKLLLLFTFLNLANSVLREHSFNDGFWVFFDAGYNVFISGNGRVAIFEVLLPIAYFLLLAPALLWLRAKSHTSIPLIAVGIFLLCTVLEKRGLTSDNLDLLSAGILGMAFGLVSLSRLDALAKNPVWAIVLYACYQAISHFFGESYPVQMFAATTSLLLLYSIAKRLNLNGWSGHQMILLGKYSLFAYLIQIPLLRLFVKPVGGKSEVWSAVWIISLSTTLVVLLLVWASNHARRKSRFADLSYRSVFA